MAELQPVAGQIVCVVTPRLGGGAPMYAPYIVAEPNPDKAAELVRQFISPNEQITVVYPLPQNVLDAFGVMPGKFTFWRAL